MPDNEWPPARRNDESDDEWMERLDAAIAERHGAFLKRLADGDENALLEVLYIALPPPEVEADFIDEYVPMSEEAHESFVLHVITGAIESMEAVRIGDPDAVAEYISQGLAMEKFNTAHHLPDTPSDK